MENKNLASGQPNPTEVELAKYNLSLVIEWIKFADSKATFLLTVALAAVGLSLTELPSATQVLENLLNMGHWIYACILCVLHAGFYSYGLYTLYVLVSVVRPTLVPKSERHSWFFFQSLALLPPDQFRAFSDALDAEQKVAHLTDQIYNNAVVARKKYERINHAINTLIATLLFGVFAIIPVLTASGWLQKAR